MRVTLLLVAAGLVACATGDGEFDGPLDEVGVQRRATMEQGLTTTLVRGTVRTADGVHAGEALVEETGGEIIVHRELDPDGDQRIVVYELTIAYLYIPLPVEYFHEREALTGISVRLERPMSLRAQGSADGVLWMSGRLDLRLDWSLLVDGDVHPLLSQTLSQLDTQIVVTDDERGLRVDLSVLHPGAVWRWADILTFGDVDLRATAYGSID
jgi:hypothetical protein